MKNVFIIIYWNAVFQFWFIRIRIPLLAGCTTHLVRIVQKMNEFESIKLSLQLFRHVTTDWQPFSRKPTN